MPPVRLVLCNVPEDDAEPIAKALVEERMAACVNRSAPIVSVYWWDGVVQEETEVTLTIKTTPDRLAAMSQRLIDLHPNEVPEILVVPVEAGHTGYFDWVVNETRPR